MGLVDETRQYEKKTTIEYHECDCKKQMSISYMLKYIQQVGMEHCDQLELSTALFQKLNMAFMLAKSAVDVKRYPRPNEKVVILTTPDDIPVKAQFKRTTIVSSEETGEELFCVDARWIICNLETGRIMRKRPEQIAFPVQTNITFELDMKIPKKEYTNEITNCEYTVRYSDLDTNQHVNNTVYANMICDAVPYEYLATKQIKSAVISYKNQAFIKDEIYITVYQKEEQEDTLCVIGVIGDSVCFESYLTFEDRAV